MDDSHSLTRQSDFAGANAMCLAPAQTKAGGMNVGIRAREDYDYARTIVDMPLLASHEWASWGFCRLPQSGLHVRRF